MASKVNICNRALARLGASRITALTDNTSEAKYCNLLYNDVAAEVMVMGSWTAATRRAELNATVDTPDFEYSYEFQLPTNPKCLKVLSVDEWSHGAEEFKIEGDKLLSNNSTAHIKYIAYLTDPESYGVYLTSAIIARLAFEMSYPLVGQASIRADLRQESLQDIAIALSLDGQQGSADELTSDTLLDVRW